MEPINALYSKSIKLFNTLNEEESTPRYLEVSRLIKNNHKKISLLFGIFAGHSPELCPLNNKNSKKIFLEIQRKMKANQKKLNILKIVGFYVSVLEHEWVIILNTKNAHDIEQLCITVGISAISTVKIVPINDFNKVIAKLRST